MGVFMCWAPDLETEAKARCYKSDAWKGAVEQFAAWSYGEEEFDELVIHVRAEDGALYKIQVDAETELTFSLGLGEKIEDAEESKRTKKVKR